MAVERITIIGLGLLGASLASIFRKKNSNLKITGVSSSATVDKAVSSGVIDEGFGYEAVNTAVENSDFVFLCTPITHILDTLNKWSSSPPAFKRECIVSDVGSTKSRICSVAQRVFPTKNSAYFIGSHPMAGSEQRGFESRDAYLFENTSWIICPLKNTPEKILRNFINLVSSTGARPTVLAVDAHDTVVANISHLPQVISSALAGFIADKENVLLNAVQVAGSGFRDMTRLADSAFSVWDPIFRTNKIEIQTVLEQYCEYLSKVTINFKNEQFEDFFKRGKMLRDKLTRQTRRFSLDLADILLNVPDKPGILAGALTVIAKKNLNILDIEILRVREGESGTIRIGFKKESDAQAAVEALKEEKFDVTAR